MRFRKKYSLQEAKQEIQKQSMMLENCYECINTFTIKEDPLIQALVGKTRAEIIEENKKQIEYILEKIEYLQQFI